MKLGNLYFLQVDGNGPVKIGHTVGCPALRVRTLQQSSPYILRWVGACRAPKADELAAHRKFDTHRVRSEWFHPAPSLLEFIKDRCGDFDPEQYVQEHFRTDIAEKLRIAGLRRGSRWERICELASVQPADLWRWLDLRKALSHEQYGRIEAAIPVVVAEMGTA